MNNIFKNTKEVGDYGEDLAVNFLEKNGFKVIDRNVRLKGGEIDIIAYKDSVIHIVEVKTVIHETPKIISRETNNHVIHETGDYIFHPEDNVHYYKLKRLQKLAELYILKHSIEYDFQIDVIAITINDTEKRFTNNIEFFEAVS